MFQNQKCSARITKLGATKAKRRTKENSLFNKKNELAKYQEAINYYNQYGKKLSDEIIKVANLSYKHEIDFFSTFKV
jgi:cobalt-zinc-cadmium resistance protein CzcA